jgi:thioredoxin-like negative regulator of GroEL
MQTKGALKLAKVNSDTQEQLAQAFNIKSYVARQLI